MLSFSSIGSNTSYPAHSYDGQDNQSYGFTPPYKIQTGDSRGELTIKGIIRIVDTNGTVVMVMGYKPNQF